MTEDRIKTFGRPGSERVFIQMVDDHDLDVIHEEVRYLEELNGDDDWMIVTVHVNDWNTDLTPWEAPPVFGNTGFGSGAGETLKYLLKDVIPEYKEKKLYIAGYSLAGLFALWASYETDVFMGSVCASPSVWYPGWVEYAEKNIAKTDRIYLSLGDKESKTRNQIMSKVKENIEKQHEILKGSGISCTLEWNPGNHFKDPALRIARGMAWILK